MTTTRAATGITGIGTIGIPVSDLKVATPSAPQVAAAGMPSGAIVDVDGGV